MNRKDILYLIRNSLENQNIDFDSTAEKIEEWDSLGHLSILVAIDKKLNGKAGSIQELSTADSVKKIIDILLARNLIDTE